MMRFRKIHEQLSLDRAVKCTGRGGWRPGSGRPRGRRTIPHDKRPDFAPRNPQHITLRTVADAPNLARDYLMATIRGAIRDSHKGSFRIIEFNVLGNHLHLIAEAGGAKALGNGMQGFEVRLVRRINKRLKRTGTLFATRYHARTLTTPRDVRNTLRYVLCNRKHHAAEKKFDKFWIDPFSSAPWFTGWATPIVRRHRPDEPRPNAEATVWLLTTGWKRYGPLQFDERPA
jgi:REP element-mobilizing transposase RayT